MAPYSLRQSKRKRTESNEPDQEIVLPPTTNTELIRNDSQVPISPNQSILDLGTGYNSVESYRTYLLSLTSRDQQYDALWNLAQSWSAQQVAFSQVAEVLDDLATQLDLRDMMKDDKSDIWSQVANQANVARSQRNDRDTVREKVCKKLGKENVDRDFIELWDDTLHTWKYLHALATEREVKKLGYDDLKRSILQAQLGRLFKIKRGTSNVMGIVAKDLRDARDIIKSDKLKDTRSLDNDLAMAGFGTSAIGFICSSGRVISSPPDDLSESSVELAPRALITDANKTTSEKSRNAFQSRRAELTDLPNEYHEEMDIYDTHNLDTHEDYESSDDTISIFNGTEDSDWDGGRSKKRRARHSCGCSKEIPKGFCEQFGKNYRPDAIAQALIIKNWFKHSKVGKICFDHTRAIVHAMGMKTKGRSQEGLEKLSMQFYTAIVNNKVGELQSDESTYHLFRKDARPYRTDDALGAYKLAHKKTTLDFTEADQKILQLELCIDTKAWDKVGSINMDGMSWWRSEEFTHNGMTIFDVAKLEFEMYHHHLRKVDNEPNYGWLRDMYHGLVQQVMRQDPWYWMTYVALRGDLKHDLVSYPYYAKYQHEGDSTFFRHIDISLPRLAESGQGLYQIQGTLSLDDERDDDCTEILPGMHKNTEEWTADLRKRPNLKLGAAIHNIGSKEYTEEDEMKYAVSWTPVPCKALQVRITDPRIPHGARGPAKGVRRTMLPWYVGLQTGLQHLEIGEAGTFQDLAAAHLSLLPGPRSPSGLPNRYAKIPYPFPAAIPLTGLGVLSDALVCRARHDSAPVMALKKELLLGGSTTRNAYLHQWRKKAVVAVVEGWKEVEKLERDQFGEKSWFRRQDMIVEGVSVPEIVADVDENAQGLEIGCHGHEDELEFAGEGEGGDVADVTDD